MYTFRWLSVTLLTLLTTTAAHAQSTPFSVLGLTSLFGQDSPAERTPSMLPRTVRPAVAASECQPLKDSLQVLLGAMDEEKACSGSAPSKTCAQATGCDSLAWSPAAAERAISRALDEPISVAFDNTPLHQVVDDLRAQAGINIIADRAALQDAGIDLATPLSFTGSKITLRSALNILLDQVKLTYVIRDEVLQVTTKETARGRLRTEVYSVADLMGPDPALVRNLTAYQPPPAECGTPVENLLMDLIQRAVASETWRDSGGRGTIQFYPLGRALVVNQTPDVQEEIATTLAALRRLQRDLNDASIELNVGTAQLACTAAACAAKTCQTGASQNVSQSGIIQAGVLTPDLGCGDACKLKAQTSAMPSDASSHSLIFGLGFNSDLGLVGNILMSALKCDSCGACLKQTASKAAAGCPLDCGLDCCNVASPPSGVRSIMVLPPPTTWVADDNDHAPIALDLRTTLESLFAASPPIYVPRPYAAAPAPQSVPRTLTQVLVNTSATSNVPDSSASVDGSTAGKQKVRLVTPHFEAHCDRLAGAGGSDHVFLEGDVHLMCYRNGQIVHIEGQRVRVQLADGAFTVEAMPETKPAVSTSRGRVLVPLSAQGHHQPASYPAAPWERVRPVQPIQGYADTESGKFED